MDQFSQLAGKEASARSSGAETSNAFDVQIQGVRLYYLPIETRVPLKFGSEVLTSVTCARAHVTVKTTDGRLASGWGETPLSVQWVWPSTVSYSIRHERIKQFAELVQTRRARADEARTYVHDVGQTNTFQDLLRRVDNVIRGGSK
jgi:hypothetical protein